MSEIFSTLLAEGNNDEALTFHLTWLLRHNFPATDVASTIFVSPDEVAGIPRTNISERMRQALFNHPCDILFVHRDADAENDLPRAQEIRDAAAELAEEFQNIVSVIPVQALEAWLLFDSAAIYRAVGRTPRQSLTLPLLREIEGLHNPKQEFHNQLRNAAQFSGCKASQFKPHQTQYYLAVARSIAESPTAFAPLLDSRNQVASFQRLNRAIQTVGEQNYW